MTSKKLFKKTVIVLFSLSMGVAVAAGMRIRSQGAGAYTAPPATPSAGAFSISCPNGICQLGGNVPPGTIKVTVTGTGPGGSSISQDLSGNPSGGSWSGSLPALGANGAWSFSLSMVQSGGTQVSYTYPSAIAVWPAPSDPSKPTASCVVGSCTVTGTIPNGATGVKITGSGGQNNSSSAGPVSYEGASGSIYSVPVSVPSSGSWTFTAVATNPGVSVSNPAVSIAYTVPAALAVSLVNNQAIDSNQLQSINLGSVASALNASNCGADGISSCLTALNNSLASSDAACPFTSTSASDSDIASHISCVLKYSLTQVASNYSPPTSQTASGGNACQIALYGQLPQFCASSKWSCTVTGTNWSKDSAPNVRAKWTKPSGYNGAGQTTSYSVAISLTDYPGYQLTQSPIQFPSVALSSGPTTPSTVKYTDYILAQQAFTYCTNRGGALANYSTSAPFFVSSQSNGFWNGGYDYEFVYANGSTAYRHMRNPAGGYQETDGTGWQASFSYVCTGIPVNNCP